MYLSRLILTHFKNYSSQTVHFSEGVNGIVGPNGMGKTNLLDAVYYLCMSKSRFSVSDRLLIQHEADFFRLEGHFLREGKPEKVVAKVAKGRKKEIERDDAPYERISEHVGRYPVVMIAPDDIQLALEGSEERRRFIDNTLSQIDAQYLTQLIQYNHILRQRNAYLKQVAEWHQSPDESLLTTYDRQLLAPSDFLLEARKSFIARFIPIFQAHYGAISGNQEQVVCHLRSQLLERPLSEWLMDLREKDRLLQRTNAGIHKDDLEFLIDDYPVKQFASQGQLKSFVLAMKLAQYELLQHETGQYPILLLDDLFAKLDRHRVEHLMTWIVERSFGQVLISDTELDRLSAVVRAKTADCRFFEVNKGTISTPNNPITQQPN
ncbi:MAG: DNA replication/repair protein RecF [Saprospirales bacterium]|nr:DNA replication/repair protein RecF [Saprospirales bacterium]